MTMRSKQHLTLDYHDDAELPWKLRWAVPDGLGYRIGPAVGEFRTAQEARTCRRQVYDSIGLYPVPTQPPTPQARAAYAERKARKARTRRIAELAVGILREQGCTVAEAVSQARAIYEEGA